MAVASLFEDLLDQYKIEQHIAEKRYTDLYQAYDVDDDRQVRLDILRADFAEDSSFAGRLVNRARALAQVRHPNIAQVLHIGKASNGAPYVVQAVVDGYPLSYRLEQLAQRSTPANPIYALKMIRQLAEALLLAERLEIFHYDLQPDNILLKNVTLPTDDTVVLVDLFIPAEGHPRAPLSDVETAAQGYLSPEQRAGREITAASHIYSLGAMLFRLLAGRLPGRPVTLRDTVLGRLFGRATPLERERGDLTPATYALIERSLRKDPRGRYPSIESFTAALDGALAAEEVRPGGLAGRPSPRDRRPLAWLLPLLIVALLVAVGGVATRSLLNRGETAGEVATIPVVGEAGGPTMSPTAERVIATEEPETTVATVNIVAPVVSTETPVPAEPSATPTNEPTATPTQEPTATPTMTLTPAPPQVRVMLNLVNLRRGPGVVYPLLGSVAGGETLEVLAWNNDEETPWYLVLTDDQRIGWIAASVVQAEDSMALTSVPVAATLPPTPFPTSTPTATPTIAIIVTIVPTSDLGESGGGGGTRPPVRPTDAPTEPPIEPTATPPPLDTVGP